MVITMDKWHGPRNYKECDITIAAPGVVTLDNPHYLGWKDQVIFATTGTLPTGISADTWYYVIPVDDFSFQITATPTGSAITTTGTQSGTHSCASDSRQIITPKGINFI